MVVAALFAVLVLGVGWLVGGVWLDARQHLKTANLETKLEPVGASHAFQRFKSAVVAAEIQPDARSACTLFGSAIGGSPPSQHVALRAQFAFGAERTLRSGAVRWAMACQIERNYTKDEVDTLLMNTAFYGRGAYGPVAAADAWFGKPVDGLSLAESAFLAGKIKAPSSTLRDSDLARRDFLLTRMLKLHLLSEGEYSDAIKEPLQVAVWQSLVE